jgi:hypothetical protein
VEFWGVGRGVGRGFERGLKNNCMKRGKKRNPRNWFGSFDATNRPGVVDRVIGSA